MGKSNDGGWLKHFVIGPEDIAQGSPSRLSISKRWRIPTICDVIWVRECVVRIAVESKVDLLDAFMHGADECGKIAKPVFVLFAAFDTSHRQNSVVENEPD